MTKLGDVIYLYCKAEDKAMYRIDELEKLWKLKTAAKSLLMYYHYQTAFDDLLVEIKSIEPIENKRQKDDV